MEGEGDFADECLDTGLMWKNLKGLKGLGCYCDFKGDLQIGPIATRQLRGSHVTRYNVNSNTIRYRSFEGIGLWKSRGIFSAHPSSYHNMSDPKRCMR